MTANPITIPETGTVDEASQLMDRLAIRHLPVVDEEGRLVGILSDRDLRGSGLRRDRRRIGAPTPTTPVTTVMVRDVVTAAPADDLATIARLMADAAVGAIPIIDAHRAPVGIISYVDVLLRLVREAEDDRCSLERIDGF